MECPLEGAALLQLFMRENMGEGGDVYTVEKEIHYRNCYLKKKIHKMIVTVTVWVAELCILFLFILCLFLTLRLHFLLRLL